MKYVVYSIGFFITLLLMKPLGLFLAAIVGIALSAAINTLFIDQPAEHNNQAENIESASSHTSEASISSPPAQQIIASEAQANWINNLNRIQKIGFFTVSSIIVFAIFLHFPFSGYSNTKYVEENQYKHLCPKLEDIDKEEEIRGKKFSDSEILEKLKHCHEGTYRTTSFLKWESNTPVLEWFRGTSNTLAFIMLSLIIGAIFISTFKTDKR